MKTFLKVLLLAVLLVLLIKLGPVILLAALGGLCAAALLGIVGFSLLTGFVAVLIAFALALSPIWLTVLVVMGLIALFRRDERPATPPPAPMAPPPVAAA